MDKEENKESVYDYIIHDYENLKNNSYTIRPKKVYGIINSITQKAYKDIKENYEGD